MKNLIVLLVLLISFSFGASSLRLVTETSYHKLINGDSGLELLVKTSIKLQDDIVLKVGVSEGYTGNRATPFMFNHAGLRFDIGCYWIIANDFMVGYTHSERNWIDGASPKSVFIYDSVDSFSVRKEFELKF